MSLPLLDEEATSGGVGTTSPPAHCELWHKFIACTLGWALTCPCSSHCACRGSLLTRACDYEASEEEVLGGDTAETDGETGGGEAPISS